MILTYPKGQRASVQGNLIFRIMEKIIQSYESPIAVASSSVF